MKQFLLLFEESIDYDDGDDTVWMIRTPVVVQANCGEEAGAIGVQIASLIGVGLAEVHPIGIESWTPTDGGMVRPGKTVMVNGHSLFTDFDEDRPSQICDGNGSVVLGLCRICGAAEIELREPCKGKRPEPVPLTENGSPA